MKNKILSFLTAFAMILSVVAQPFATSKAAAEETKSVTIHKILLSEDALKAHDVNKEYDGNTIANIKDFFGDQTAEEISGVYFKLQKANKDDADVNNDADWTDVEGKAGLTEATGLKLDTTGLKGQYRIVEDLTKSEYKGKDGQSVLTGSKAVPTLLTLPLVNEGGVVEEAHVYPKNTENRPEIDKNFAKENDLKDVDAGETGSKVGADYENYQKKKATVTAEIGKVVPYQVKTKIPANSKLKTAKWDDKMTSGLTYNKGSLTIKVAGVELEEADYTLEETDEGFVLNLTETGLAKINEKDEAVEVELTYNATVNSSAVVDIPEANDIMFHYGNQPSQSTTPYPTKPDENGDLKVNKTWDDGVWAEGETATFKLVDANTGEDVTKADLVNAPEDYEFKGTVQIGYNKEDGATYTWKYLNKDKQYKAIEIASTTGSDSEYVKAEDGTIKVVNHKSNNPQPLNPTEPKVVNGGKKFVKTNNEDTNPERLAGAEFYIKNNEGQYLVAAAKDATAVTAAKTALDEKVKAYNELTAEKQEGQAGTDAKAAIDAAQEAYNKAFIDNAQNYTFEADKANAVVVTSDAQGRFEIKGLAYGSYKLEEKTAPKDYAKLTGDINFEVKEGTYAGADTELQYNAENTDNGYGQQIKNKKVSIPQTGGIGSLIFVVAGLVIMGLAAYKMKANRQEA